jgi:predicted glutamine amidotransferase
MHAVTEGEAARAVIVSSERLTADADDYTHVPDNHTITVTPDLTIKLEAIEA